MPRIDYSKFIVTQKGASYPTAVRWSHYNEPIDRADGRMAGNSRIWGDAPAATQQAAIDAIVAAAKDRGLSTRETAHVLAIARTESGFNPDAAAGTTSASGLGQFINKTGAAYDLDASNRWSPQDQAGALVDHFVDNRDLAVKRGLGEDYIYKFHHDGPTGEYGGLGLSQKKIMPLIDGYEAALTGGGASISGAVATSSPPAGSLPSGPATLAAPTPTGPIASSDGSGYTIRSGDTLSQIAARHGVSADDLAAANGIAEPNRIQAGQTLTIPGQAKNSESPGSTPPSPPPDPAAPATAATDLGDFGSPNIGDDQGSTNGTGVDLAADLSDPANLTDADEAELTPNFASMNALLNGSEGADFQNA